MLYLDNKTECHVKTYTVALEEKVLRDGPWRFDNVDVMSSMIIPVPDPFCGAIVVAEETITYYASDSYYKCVPIDPCEICAYGYVDTNGSRILLGDTQGFLYMLVLEYAEGGTMVENLKVEPLGQTNCPSSISYLDNGNIYIGSAKADSQIIELTHERDPETGNCECSAFVRRWPWDHLLQPVFSIITFLKGAIAAVGCRLLRPGGIPESRADRRLLRGRPRAAGPVPASHVRHPPCIPHTQAAATHSTPRRGGLGRRGGGGGGGLGRLGLVPCLARGLGVRPCRARLLTVATRWWARRCSGTFKDGSLRQVSNGIGINETAEIELPGIQGMWSLRETSTAVHHKYLVQSFVGETRMLAVSEVPEPAAESGAAAMDEDNADEEDEEEGGNLEEGEIEGFASDCRSLLCANMVSDMLVQVTPTQIRLVACGSHTCVDTWSSEGSSEIVMASCSPSQILVATADRQVAYLTLSDGADGQVKLDEVSKVTLEHEIACLCCAPCPEGSTACSLVAVGMWTEISVRLLRLPSLEVVTVEKLGGDVIPRSMVITRFDGAPMLICGCARWPGRWN